MGVRIASEGALRCPLMWRLFTVGRLTGVDPSQCSQEPLKYTEIRHLPQSASEQQLINDMQRRIRRTIHELVVHTFVQNSGKEKGMMSLEPYIKARPDLSKFQLYESATMGCPQGFVRVRPYGYRMQDGNEPAQALKRFFKGPTLVDSGLMVEAIFFSTMARCLGAAKFNRLFQRPSMHFRLQNQGALQLDGLLSVFTRCVAGRGRSSRELRSLVTGTRLYFNGIPWYAAKHPFGEGEKLHVITMLSRPGCEPRFCGDGLSRMASQEEIINQLFSQYQKPCKPKERQAHFSHAQEFLNTYPHLANYQEEIKHCFSDPDKLLCPEKGRSLIRLEGFAGAEYLSPEILAFIASTPEEEVGTEHFWKKIVKMHKIMVCQEIVEGLERIQDSCESTSP